MRRRPTFTRADRISSLMRSEVKRVIEFELSSPLARHVYVTATKLSGDMGHLRIRFVMKERQDGEAFAADGPLSDHGSVEKAQLMLDHSAGYVARVLCEVLQLRKAPKIVFSYDKEYEQMKRVKVILDAEHVARGTTAPSANSMTPAPSGALAAEATPPPATPQEPSLSLHSSAVTDVAAK